MASNFLDYDKDVTLVQRICSAMRKMIRENFYEVGSKLPNEIELAKTFKVSRGTMRAALSVFPIVRAMAEEGNPNSVSDAGVGALAARSALFGARLNVRINAAGLKDRAKADALVADADALAAEAERLEREVLEIVERKIG